MEKQGQKNHWKISLKKLADKFVGNFPQVRQSDLLVRDRP